MASTRFGLLHLNNNLLCAIHIETTGNIPFFHDLIQIAILPLDTNLKPHREFLPITLDLQPKRPENVDRETITKRPGHKPVLADGHCRNLTVQQVEQIMRTGLDPFKAADLFEAWFERLGLAKHKKLSPLAHNWKLGYLFILDWLCGPENMGHFFDGRYRDTIATALFLNDYYDFHTKTVPFPKVNLRYLASQLKIEFGRSHDSLEYCQVVAEAYRLMLRDSLLNMPFIRPEEQGAYTEVPLLDD